MEPNSFESTKMLLLEEAQAFCADLVQATDASVLPSLLETFGQNFVKISKVPFTLALVPLAMPQDEDEIELSINSKNFTA